MSITVSRLKKGLLGASTGLFVAGILAAPAAALTASNTTTQTKTTAGTSSTANSQAKLQLIINRGNSEISRRLSSLNSLLSRVNANTYVSSSDKSVLTQEINDEISNLNSLKTKLDADTDVTTAKADAQSIITDYRVYALVVPKANLVLAASHQLAAEQKLSDLATKLQTRLSSSTKKDPSLQSALTDMQSKISAAQTLSNTVDTSVIGLQPSDYNSDHNVLSGYRTQLKTAQTDIQAAVQDAKTIIAGLKTQ